MIDHAPSTIRPLIDGHGRRVTYLRVSVTDRCDFRCTYCMAERMQFLPRHEVLSVAEIDAIASAFIARGVHKLRLTGGEPLVRRDIMDLVRRLSRHLETGALHDLTLTTNGSQLARHATELAALGVRRVNVSLDTRDADRFAAITRRGRLDVVLEGIAAARQAGLAIKINMVPLAGINEDEIVPIIKWAHGEGYALTLIEAMPMGETGEDRSAHHLPLRLVRDRLARQFTLTPSTQRTGGPARYMHVAETGGTLGFITPLTHNFCESCNRVRLTSSGALYLCLGQEDRIDLRAALRNDGAAGLDAALDRAMILKPAGHDFVLDGTRSIVATSRHMSVTGG